MFCHVVPLHLHAFEGATVLLRIKLEITPLLLSYKILILAPPQPLAPFSCAETIICSTVL